MFSTGLLLFVFCFILGVHNSSSFEFTKTNKRISSFTGWGVLIGMVLMLLSIVIHLWKVLP